MQQVTLSFETFVSGRMSPALICSIPKSGTYLVSALLQQLGSEQTHFHVSKNEYSDYRTGNREDHRRHPEHFRVVAPFKSVLDGLAQGQHAVSHLPCSDEVQEACRQRGIRVIFLFRDLRDCVVSYMRFLADTGRDNSRHSEWIKEQGPRRLVCFLKSYGWFFEAAEPLIPWEDSSIAVSVRYEDLVGHFGPEAQRGALDALCGQLGISSRTDADRVLQDSLNTPTLTWSGARINRNLYWSDEAEEQFVRLRGAAVNAQLHYT